MTSIISIRFLQREKRCKYGQTAPALHKISAVLLIISPPERSLYAIGIHQYADEFRYCNTHYDSDNTRFDTT